MLATISCDVDIETDTSGEYTLVSGDIMPCRLFFFSYSSKSLAFRGLNVEINWLQLGQ